MAINFSSAAEIDRRRRSIPLPTANENDFSPPGPSGF
jgi:hypothetical protein